MAQTGSTMRLFVSEFLLMATSDRINLQNQSIKRALNGILDFSHPILPPKSVSHCLILFISMHATPGHGSRLQSGSHCWVFPFLALPHPLHQQATSLHSFHFLGPVWSCWPLLQQTLHFCSWLLQSILCKTTGTIFAKGNWSLWVFVHNFLLPLTLFLPQEQ